MDSPSSHHFLVADSNAQDRATLSGLLGRQGHRVSQAGDGASALDLLNRNVFQLIITELELPGVGGLDLIGRVQDNSPSTPVIVTSNAQSVDSAVEAMRRGAYDFQHKPINLEHLRITVGRALERAHLGQAFNYLRHEQPYLYRLESITAESAAMAQVLDQVRRLAPTGVTVLLTGETGTGKSLIAGAIHANSPRREGTLVTVNCAALPETLLESELFGHERGAFTGAHKSRDGRFQQAHGGTLFLDEVAEMSPGLQAKLLRAIEDQVIYRLGGSREVHVDVRILAATNRDLAREVEAGRFRKDLYYRLAVAPINMPPLRDRIADVLPLAQRFLQRTSAELNRGMMTITPEAESVLMGHSWPGNIRELRNVIERAALFADKGQIRIMDLGLAGGGPMGAQAGQGNNLAAALPTMNLAILERMAIEAALDKSGYVQKEAARHLGLSERQMTYRLDKLGFTDPRFRTKSRRG